ncbi:MAG: DUF342 domain-containing protein [Desulfovibrio sp.]|nr:MAG: DUF342 domain-containing protein [Desulfovibrio sp.]
MQARVLPIRADNEQAALKMAAEKFNAPPDNIEIKDAGDGRYEASLAHCDAEIEIDISNDGMTATVAEGRPALGRGRALSLHQFKKILTNSGVRVQYDPVAAQKVIDALEKGEQVKGVVIAKGVQPVQAKDADIEPLGDWAFPVFPSDAIGRLIPASQSEPGVKISGTKIPAPGGKRGKDISFPEDAHCHIDTTSLLVRSETFGLVEYQRQEVRVTPLLEPAKDGMSALATVYPHDFSGKPFTPERMQEAFEEFEIVEKADGRSLASAVEEAKEKGAPVHDVVVCRGMKPIDGKDGRFEMVFKDDRSVVGSEAEDGSMDYRSRGVVRSVGPGELLGRIIPPEKGAPGRDIYGRVIPAREGQPLNITVGENVEASPDGKEFTSTDSGMVLFRKNVLAVSDVYETEGDVDMSSGNIDVEKGSVNVRGSILSGFAVNSPGNVLVRDVIESSNVSAVGHIDVRGGILMDRQGATIKAQGGVSALFAKNATITSVEGDVDIAHEINNCIVFAAGHVLANRGRGKIVGSTIRCGKGVEANEIGSELGVETTIFLGLEREIAHQDVEKRQKLQAILQKILGVLGTGDPRAILEKAPPEKKRAVADLLKARLKAEKELKGVEERLQEERDRIRETMKARVKVHKTIYPGAIIHCFGTTLRFEQPQNYSQFYFDTSENKIVCASL